MRTFDEALRGAVRELEAAGVPEAELSAWYLLEEVTGKDKAWFLLHREEALPEAETERFATLVERRKKRVPLEYLIHRAEFMGLSFYVDDRVLIPRQDTECLVEEALTYAEGSDVLDLCTGSGCIAISLAVLGKPRSMTATDVSAEALSVAKQNAEANGAGNKYTAVEFKQGDLWEAVTPAADAQVAGQAAEQAAGQAAEQAAGTQVVEQPAADACAAGSIEPTQFDLITCNPPYIRRAEIPTLMPEVQEYEPILALDGGEDGLDFYRRLVAGADAHLRENGRLICEIGYDQGEAVATLMRDAGLTDVQVKQDLAGLDRLVSGRKPVA